MSPLLLLLAGERRGPPVELYTNTVHIEEIGEQYNSVQPPTGGGE